MLADGPEPGCWTGLAGMAEAWRGFLGAWEEAHTEVEEYRELDGERVLVLERFSARGKASGLEVGRMRTEGAALFQVGGGNVTRLVVYWDRERPLADLGLAPEASSSHS